MRIENSTFKWTIPLSELSVLSPTFKQQKIKSLFNSIYNSPSTTYKSLFRNNIFSPLNCFNNSSTFCLKKKKNKSLNNYSSNKELPRTYKCCLRNSKRLYKTIISNKKSISLPKQFLTKIKPKKIIRDELGNISVSLSLSSSERKTCPILDSKKRIDRIIPKDSSADKLLSPEEFIRNSNRSLVIRQKKISSQSYSFINKEINKAYESHFSLIQGNRLSERYPVSKKYIDVFPDNIKDDYPRNTKISRERIKESSRRQMIIKRVIEKASPKTHYNKFKKIMIKSAIQFKQMNINIKDFYTYYHIQAKPFEEKGSNHFIKAVKDGDINEVREKLKENPCLVSSFDSVRINK